MKTPLQIVVAAYDASPGNLPEPAKQSIATAKIAAALYETTVLLLRLVATPDNRNVTKPTREAARNWLLANEWVWRLNRTSHLNVTLDEGEADFTQPDLSQPDLAQPESPQKEIRPDYPIPAAFPECACDAFCELTCQCICHRPRLIE